MGFRLRDLGFRMHGFAWPLGSSSPYRYSRCQVKQETQSSDTALCEVCTDIFCRGSFHWLRLLFVSRSTEPYDRATCRRFPHRRVLHTSAAAKRNPKGTNPDLQHAPSQARPEPGDLREPVPESWVATQRRPSPAQARLEFRGLRFVAAGCGQCGV